MNTLRRTLMRAVPIVLSFWAWSALPAQANVDGAIFTTTVDGTTVNGNIYTAKEDVYLNGGPQNTHANGLPDGNYYFQVTDPSGSTLLSTDDISCRQITVINGRFAGASGSCPHANGTFNPANQTTAVQLVPYDDTPNPGGEYKAWLTPVDAYPSVNCPAQHRSFGFCDRDSKTDNFKVRRPQAAHVTVCKFNDVDGDGVQGAGEPRIPHWPITASGVDGGTVNAQTNDDGCVSFTFSGFTANHTTQTVVLTEGTFGADWVQTAPADGSSGTITVANGVITVVLSAGDSVTAPSFGNRNLFCDASCTLDALVVTKNAAPSYEVAYAWTIAKDVDRTSVSQSSTQATFTYTVTVTRDGGSISNVKATGIIRIANPGGSAITASVSDFVDNGGSCSVSAETVTVPAGDHVDVPYACIYGDGSVPAPGTNTATATWATGSASGTAAVDFSAANVTVTDDAVDVDDSAVGILATGFTGHPAPGVFTYTRTVEGVPGTCRRFNNTATFTTNTTQTTGSASQPVEVCVGADLQVSKTATGAYDAAITKAVDKTLVQQAGGSAVFTYTITVTQSGWRVSGVITITNPNDWEDVAVDVSDVVSNGGLCVVPGGAGVVVPRSSSIQVPYNCTYPSPPPTAETGTNVATATWDHVAAFTPSGNASGAANFGFSPLNVIDTFAGGVPVALGSVTGITPVATFTQTRTIPNAAGGTCQSYDNVASIVETEQSATQTVTVCNTATGARTIGFWQNKNGQGIITNGASTAGICNSGTWLRQYAPFQDLSPTATCAQVASYTTTIIKAASSSGTSMNPMLKAQMLASALDVFFSDPALGGNTLNAPTPIGGVTIDLTQVCSNPGTCSSYSDVSPAFGGASSLTVTGMLAFAAGQSDVGGSLWYGNVKPVQELAKNAFDAINNQVAYIAP